MYRGHEDGANAVEFALVLPILLILVFGIITGGVLYNQQLALTQAAREGARFAATLPEAPTSGDACDGSDDWFERVETRTENSFTGDSTDLTIEVCRPDSEGKVSVEVQQPGRLEIIVVPPWDLTVSAQSTARYEG